jgi:plasmid maintenance system antidote protein VapI
MVNRISKLIESTGLNPTSFAAKIGVQQMTLWTQLNGRRKLSLETVRAILDTFPDVSAEWLMRGTGTMTRSNDEQDKRISNLVDVIAMQQETIRNLQEKIKQLQNQ